MRRRAALLATLLLASSPLLAGCVGGGGAAEDDAPAVVVLPEPASTPLDVTLALSTAWARPGEAVTLTAESPSATAFSWFLLPRPDAAAAADPHAGHAHGAHGGDGAAARAQDARTPPAPANTGELQPGVEADPITLTVEGLYRFHCHPHPDMTLDVVVREGAAASGTQHVQMVEKDVQRFAPDHLQVAPGTKLVFWNNGTVMHTATQEGFAWPAGTGKSVTYVAADEGDWDVLVLARDGETGRGEARARLLVDPAKPDEEQPVGPYAGSFQAAAPDQPDAESKSHPFTSDYPIAKIAFTFAATSGTPVPASVKVALLSGTTELASAAGAQGSLEAADLPAGTYTLQVTAGQGLLIEYEATGTATLLLTTPPEPASEGGGDGHDHAH